MTDIQKSTKKLAASIEELIDSQFGRYITAEVCLTLLHELSHIVEDMDADPYPGLIRTLEAGTQFAERAINAKDILAEGKNVSGEKESLAHETKKLFEEAWTVYDEKTYDHSVNLMEKRLRINGYDEGFFKGKSCFDGGCGTGRTAVAMASMGADRVVAVDFGEESLQFARAIAEKKGLSAIEYVKTDVTDLSQWPDEEFDFVVSQGVLHHTVEQSRGIREHFRITKTSGTFWLYLYGKGGFFWEIYDCLKEALAPASFENFKQILFTLEVRQGILYTFLDNFMAPIRTYYSLSDVLTILGPCGSFTWEYLKGLSTIDDPRMVLNSRYGKDILGPDAEIRLKILKQ